MTRPLMNASDVMSRPGTCVVMATYNNAGTLGTVLDGVMTIAGTEVIVVDDGSTDTTAMILDRFTGITVLRNERNRGKGFSLKRAFREAHQRGFRHAITIDSDGQHDPMDIPILLRAIEEQPGAMIMGARDMKKGGVPRRSSFGNRFSNFWFLVETGIRLPDTQTGFRAYPLDPLSHVRTISTRFGYEVEAIVKLAWRGVPFAVVPVGVRYDQPGRISHFRPFADFLHISVLNTWLVIAALFWYWPRKLLSPRKLWRTIRDEAVKHEESSLRKAVAIGFGLFMGIVPIWGFQLLAGISAAILLRLNKVLVITAAHISVPPMVPVIIYASFRMGALYVGSDAVSLPITEVSFEAISLNVVQYIQGAITLAVLAGLVGFLVSWPVIRLLRGR